MRKHILNILICVISLFQLGLCGDVKKQDVFEKIAIEAVGEKITGYYGDLLPRDSLGKPDTTLKDKFHYEYSAAQLPELKIRGLHVYQIREAGLVMDTLTVLSTLPEPEFLVAVSDDSAVFRLAGFDRQTDFGKMAENLIDGGISVKENIIPLSVLFYMTGEWPRHVKMVNDEIELRKLKKSILSDMDKATLKKNAKRIKPPSIEERENSWEVTIFLVFMAVIRAGTFQVSEK